MAKNVMYLLFTDQAEYYCVCPECYHQFNHMQWSGSTRGGRYWSENAQATLGEHIRENRPCEFCGPGGNGGWMIQGEFPAAIRRDYRKDHPSSDKE